MVSLWYGFLVFEEEPIRGAVGLIAKSLICSLAESSCQMKSISTIKDRKVFLRKVWWDRHVMISILSVEEYLPQ